MTAGTLEPFTATRIDLRGVSDMLDALDSGEQLAWGG